MKWLLGLCLILGLALVGRSVLLKRHKTADVAAAPANNSRMPASVDGKAASLTPAQQKEMSGKIETFLKKVEKELGSDNVGVASMVIFLRQVAPKEVAANAKIKDLCTTVKTCPMPLSDVYQLALKRLDDAADVPAKQIMQEQLIKSDLSAQAKGAILARNMAFSKILTMEPSTKAIDKNRTQLGPDIQYLVVSSRQLQSLKVQPVQYLQVMMTAISRSRDQIARSLIVNSLIASYPSFSQVIANDARKMGITVSAPISAPPAAAPQKAVVKSAHITAKATAHKASAKKMSVAMHKKPAKSSKKIVAATKHKSNGPQRRIASVDGQ